jgi:hypothetical protein
MDNQKTICVLNEQNDTCLPKETIQIISKLTPVNNLLNTNLTNSTNIIIEKIAESTGCDSDLSIQEKELCILNKIKNKTDDNNLKIAIERQIIKFFKIPTKSLDKNYWLNNTEIDNIQYQLRDKYPGYYFTTIHMIDLCNFMPSNNDIFNHSDKIYNIKDINFVHELTNHPDAKLTFNGPLKYFGMVCNTDLSSNGGIHWFTIFIDFTTNPIQIEYFNSSGYPLTKGTHINERKEFYLFFKNLEDDLTKNKFPANFFKVTDIEHQRNDTANCGSYSLYYIWSRLRGTSYTFFQNKKITDELMEKFRSILWRKK